MKVLFTGGGTGGHIYPALAMIGALKREFPDMEILYVGTAQGLEATIVPDAGVSFRTVRVSGLKRKLSWETAGWAGRTVLALAEAYRVVRRFRPQVVVGTGGYVAGPVLAAAAIQKVPVILHEQNAFPGKTNRWLAPFAGRILVTFEESAAYFKHRAKVVCTGLPVRQEILQVSREEGAAHFGLSPRKKTLLVVGGSQGARSINDSAPALVEYAAGRPDVQLIWSTGKEQYDRVKEDLTEYRIKKNVLGNITIRPYIGQMAHALAASDLVISRAGATFLAEVTARGVAAILIPYPFATDNHQYYNADSLASRGAAVLLPDGELSGEVLRQTVEELVANPERMKDMAAISGSLGRPDALEKIVEEIKAYL